MDQRKFETALNNAVFENRKGRYDRSNIAKRTIGDSHLSTRVFCPEMDTSPGEENGPNRGRAGKKNE